MNIILSGFVSVECCFSLVCVGFFVSHFICDQVSWVRHRDIHLLTVGRYTYTSDQRFEALHSPHTEEWTLRIRYAQRKDSGIYEVNDKNKINFTFN